MPRNSQSGLPVRPPAWLMGLALAGPLVSPARAATQEPTELTNELVHHADSRSRAFTSTRDGGWLYSSEGGTMVFIDAGAAVEAKSEAGFQLVDGVKRVPIGAAGVIVAHMALDPEAGLDPGPIPSNTAQEPTDLLYLACGRDGLWIMEADVDAETTNEAWRIDDSGNADASAQGSRRWCVAVDFMTVGGEQYLLALFSKKSHNVLRAYDLSRVREVARPASANPETGSELAPDLQVVLRKNPHAPASTSPVSFSRPVALAMAVDQGEDEADVYVAMGPHGIAKVSYPADAFPGGGSVSTTWGPVFGEGSDYDSGGPAIVPKPVGQSSGLYGDLVLETDHAFRTQQVEERREAPMVVDVAVYAGDDADGQPAHLLFAAVDHLFWMAFDLDQTFAHDMPIHHHEGVWNLVSAEHGSWQQPVVSGTTGRLGKPAYGRALEVVTHPVEGPFLLVTVSDRPLVQDYLLSRYENANFDELLEPGGSWTMFPGQRETYAYRLLRSYPDPDENVLRIEPVGGSGLVAPPEQTQPQLAFYHHYRQQGDEYADASGVCLTMMPFPGQQRSVYRRGRNHMPGKLTFNVGTSMLDPDLLLTSGNDGGVPPDGFLATRVDPQSAQYVITRHYEPTVGTRDERGIGQILFDDASQWQPDPVGFPERFMIWTSGTSGTVASLKLMDIEVPGLDGYANAPIQHGFAYVEYPVDRFGNPGRVYYQSGYLNRDFDAYLASIGHGERRLFGTWARTPEGLVVVDRAALMAAVGYDPPAGELDGGSFDIDDLPASAYRLLVTHPEFNRMPAANADLQAFWGQPAATEDLIERVQAWAPKVIEVQPDRWVLAVPCGQITADPDWDVYDDREGTLPPAGSIWALNLRHGLVQFWELTPDPLDGGAYWPQTVKDQHGVGTSPLQKIVAPDADTVFHTLESVEIEVDGQDEVYLFCGDSGGHLYVYSIRDIVDLGGVHTALDDSDHLVAQWHTKQNLFDDMDSLLYDIAIDHRGGGTAIVYVSSPRVGVQMLRFEPGGAQVLTDLGRIQTTDRASGLALRDLDDGSRQLIVSDWGGGIRIYGE